MVEVVAVASWIVKDSVAVTVQAFGDMNHTSNWSNANYQFFQLFLVVFDVNFANIFDFINRRK